MPQKLSAYNRKRDFDRTPEPEGGAEASGEGFRFVVQRHMARREHYDFRLEWDGALLSWAVPRGPSFDTRDKRLAVHVEDHPLGYRDFEGTIPRGEYGGGTVMLWDEGWWEPYSDVDEGLRKGSLKFALKGARLKGRWALVRLKPREGEKAEAAENWLLIKEKDGYAKTGADIAQFDTSVRTGRTMREIEQGEDAKVARNPFDRADAQLAAPVHALPEDGDWLYELKYDGYRILAFVEGSGARLLTRNGNDYTGRFRDIARALSDLAAGRAMVLDGEMVVADASGKTDFQALQTYMKNPAGRRLTYIVFDLLALDGEDLRGRPLIERKQKLEALLANAPDGLHYSRHVMGAGKESLAAACETGAEGIVGKRAGSVYSGTRNGDWIKLKCGRRQEFVVGGYTRTEKKAEGISALLLGVYEDGKLVYAGRAGTGLSRADMEELSEKFEGLEAAVPPFADAPEPRAREKTFWLAPELVAEIRFAEWTRENLLRQASYKGLRTDKDPGDVKRESAYGGAEPRTAAEKKEETMESGSIVIGGIRVTSPDKVIFDDPPVTKADVVRYYERVSGRMLPYVSHRVLSIVRCPKGISEACFYKKHPGPGSKGVVTLPVTDGEGETEEYFYIENTQGLLYEAQMGTLEFHAWGSRVENIDAPDMMVFDLDPDEGMELERVRRGARDIRELLLELSLVSYLKTSGGKGYHVVVPLRPAAPWEAFHDFARRVAEVMEGKWPERYTANVRKARRRGRIFIDWIRNGRGATSVAPYSIRARAGARVSMPITWEELDAVAPDGVGMRDALQRIEGGDPWEGFFTNEQRLR
ncbi:MAG: putative DNA ligase-like protein [Firmicutes bacterium ADurb.Bin248]|nr:MAG: putative DNA ligase-like protein [Firmicutes bacterium ADurb.Bin248]HOF99651.1 DNA ligase D [Clostridia bacterium]